MLLGSLSLQLEYLRCIHVDFFRITLMRCGAEKDERYGNELTNLTKDEDF